MAHVQLYIYDSLCVSFNVFCMSACEGGGASAPTAVSIVYLTAQTRQCRFPSISRVLNVFEVLHLFLTENIPFHFVLSLPCPWLKSLFLSHCKVSRKVLFGGGNIVLVHADVFPLKKNGMKGEVCGDSEKFLSLLLLSRSRLSSGKGWSACLKVGLGPVSCRWWMQPRKERKSRLATDRCLTWMLKGRW